MSFGRISIAPCDIRIGRIERALVISLQQSIQLATYLPALPPMYCILAGEQIREIITFSIGIKVNSVFNYKFYPRFICWLANLCCYLIDRVQSMLGVNASGADSQAIGQKTCSLSWQALNRSGWFYSSSAASNRGVNGGSFCGTLEWKIRYYW